MLLGAGSMFRSCTRPSCCAELGLAMASWTIGCTVIRVCLHNTGEFPRYENKNSSHVILQLQWLPESARYHVTSGQVDKALMTLEQIAKDNGRPMLLGRLVVDGPPGPRGSIKALLSPSLRRTTLLLWFIW